jgi:hypothetical protein
MTQPNATPFVFQLTPEETVQVSKLFWTSVELTPHRQYRLFAEREGSQVLSRATMYREWKKRAAIDQMYVAGFLPLAWMDILAGRVSDPTRRRIVGLLSMHWHWFSEQWREFEQACPPIRPDGFHLGPYALIYSTVFKSGFLSSGARESSNVYLAHDERTRPESDREFVLGPLAMTFVGHAVSLGMGGSHSYSHCGPFLAPFLTERRSSEFRTFREWIASERLPRTGWFLKGAPERLPAMRREPQAECIRHVEADPATWAKRYPWSAHVTYVDLLLYQWARTMVTCVMELRRDWVGRRAGPGSSGAERHELVARLFTVDPLGKADHSKLPLPED